MLHYNKIRNFATVKEYRMPLSLYLYVRTGNKCIKSHTLSAYATDHKYQRRRGPRKYRKLGSCNFPTEEIIVAQNFNFAPKFPSTKLAFLALNFVFSDKNSAQ